MQARKARERRGGKLKTWPSSPPFSHAAQLTHQYEIEFSPIPLLTNPGSAHIYTQHCSANHGIQYVRNADLFLQHEEYVISKIK